VFDLIERPLIVTEHRASIYRCARCRGVTRAAFPADVVGPTQYGERI
jgi:transposase